MKYIRIENEGEVEPRAFSLFGASVKEGDRPVGMFGSGAKYSISKLLRDHVDFYVFSGDKQVMFYTQETRFRGEDFRVIVVNGEATSLTTDTGKDWTIQQAVRELWSNAMDEPSADISECDIEPVGAKGWTRIYIEMTDEIAEMWSKWHQFFAPREVPTLAKTQWGDRIIDPKYTDGKASVYRRGVWCVEDDRVPFLFSYDMQDVKLTEARVRSSDSFSYVIDDALKYLDDENTIHFLLETIQFQPQYAEVQALSGTKPIDLIAWGRAFQRSWAFYANDRAELDYFPYHVRDRVYIAPYGLASLLDAIGVPSVYDYLGSSIIHRTLPMDRLQESMVYAAIERLKVNGIHIKWPVDFCEFKDETIAFADMKRMRILLGAKAFASETQLLKSLIEEYTHLQHDVRDGSVDQQHVYLSLIVQLLD